MEDKVTKGCKVSKSGMDDRQAYNLLIDSERDMRKLRKVEVMELSLQILFNEHEHVLIIDG
jgi:hypothetical protein